MSDVDLNCPFCEQPGFDKIGLKYHFEMGYCDVYNETETVEEERERKKMERS